LLRHAASIASPELLQAAIDALRQRVGSAPARASLGQDNERGPGGVVLRARSSVDSGPARIPMPSRDSLRHPLQIGGKDAFSLLNRRPSKPSS
ncbi:MAG: hypothetical protein K2Q97_03970, partial [Burkholderiaceae bacterium]|nr:hypothetical protein [Burkholderiaceae bacterium]